jgi:hypothetical protein
MAKKKPTKLQQAARKRLEAIGNKPVSVRDVAHALYHLQQDGRTERVEMEAGTFGWTLPNDRGEPMVVPETPELVAWLERFGADPGAHGH